MQAMVASGQQLVQEAAQCHGVAPGTGAMPQPIIRRWPPSVPGKRWCK